MANILWFKDISKEDLPTVGGKGANLGEMFSIMPIPNGFCVTVEAYSLFLEKSEIKNTIFKLLKELDPENTKQLDEISEKIRTTIKEKEVPEQIQKEIIENYKKLDNEFVAVRSSATAEDLPTASFAGQQDTYLNVNGEKNVIKNVKDCWASLFTSRAIYYRHTNKFDHEKVLISVVVQEMVDSEKAGVMFTVNPVNKDKNQMIIEGSYGLGESVVSGQVTPDTYIVQKNPFQIVDINIGSKSTAIVKKNNENKKIDIPIEKQEAQLMDEKELAELAELGVKIEQHYKKPQDIEWASFNGKLYILQSRPITTL